MTLGQLLDFVQDMLNEENVTVDSKVTLQVGTLEVDLVSALCCDITHSNGTSENDLLVLHGKKK